MGSRSKKVNLPWKPRSFLDFVIDGRSLKDDLDSDGYIDDVSIVGSGFLAEAERSWLDILLGDKQPALESGRVESYVCGECGDIGCGSITISLEFEAKAVVWRDFGFEVNYWFDDPAELLNLADYRRIGPLRLDREQYRHALQFPPPKPV
jgi:hypothetical protein